MDNNKPKMTDEERLALAAELDRQLDEFIDTLPRRAYNDGWPEDRWEEEMDKHPFFMKKAPEPGEEVHPLMAGLQKLKYDPEENEPEELATAYKVDGNFNFEHKNYRLAILSYTEGIKAKCGVVDLEASLLNNRSAAHYFLKNYLSALRDCELALKLKPDYHKCTSRAAHCCFEMRKLDKCLEYCNKFLQAHPDDSVILDLRKKCVITSVKKERDSRIRQIEAKRRQDEQAMLISAINKQGVTIDGGNHGRISIADLEPHFPDLVHTAVYLDENNNLVWPVVLLYPEYKRMDFIQDFMEKQTLADQFSQVFSTLAEWDEEKKYKMNSINVYYETTKRKLVTVDMNKTLMDILKEKQYVVKGGTPSFIILAKDSPAEKRFLAEY